MTTFGTRGGSTAGKSESPVSPKSKRCARCKVVKPIECFYRHRRTPDGRVYRCKRCW